MIPLIFIAYPLLLPGIPIGDGDLPVIETSLYSSKKLWTWTDYGSYHGMEVLPRYPIILFIQLINISPEITSKLLIIGGFAIASFSFYFSCLIFFRSKIDIHDIKFRAGVILGSLFYAYNVWSFHRIGHWYFWLGYAILPLFFVSIINAYNNPKKWRYILASVLLWSIASSTIHMTIFFGVVFAGLSIIYLIKYIRKNQKLSIQPLKPIFLIIAVYLLANLYWIYPYISSLKSEAFIRDILVTEETTRALSAESHLLNVLRLIEGTFNMGTINVVPSDTSALYPVWIFASFVFPILAFSTLLWKKNLFKITLFFSVLTIIGLFVTIGSNAPFNFYSIFLFYTPLISNLQLVFREPDKWGFLVAFGYSFLIVIASFKILNKLENINHKSIYSVSFIFFMLSAITIYTYPAYKDSLENLYRPIVLPVEFKMLNNYKFNNTDKVLIIPHTSDNTTWGSDKGTRHLYTVASPYPNIHVAWVYFDVEKYHEYLLNSIIENKTDNIQDIISPLGASYLLYHNDTLMPHNNDLINKLSSSLMGVEYLDNVGFFKIFQIDDGKKIRQVNIPMDSSVIVGGLDQLASMNVLSTFNSINSSLLFLDQKIKGGNDYSAIRDAKYVFLKPSQDNFILSFLDNKFLVVPFDATNHHEVAELWSKASSNDPGNGWFNPYLDELGIENWDFDYGRGLVITKKMGEKLSIPVKVEENLDYDIFIRYLKNQRGGVLKVNLDDKLVREIDTYDKISNNFVWEKIGAINLTKGKHVLTIENVAGLNAVNIFAVVPSKETENLKHNAYLMANKAKNIFLLEAESNFYNSKGRDNGSSFDYLFHYDNYNWSSNKTLTGLVKVPRSTDLVSLQFVAKQNANNSARSISNNNDSYTMINSLFIDPAHKNYPFALDFENRENQSIFALDFENRENQSIFDVDFERQNIPISPMVLMHSDFINHNNKSLSILPEANRTIFGNNSLRVDVKPSNDTTKWNKISTDFIPVNENEYYNFSLYLSAKDVNQLHSKVNYFDSNKTEIKSAFISGGRNGTFEAPYNIIDSSLNGTKYMQLQILARSNPNMSSSYIIDNVKIEKVPPGQVSFQNYNEDSLSISTETNRPIYGNNSLRVYVKPGNDTTKWNKISTDFIPVNENEYYNFSLYLSAKDVNQLHSKVNYFDSNKTEIKSAFISGGRNGTFEAPYNIIDSSLNGTKYMQLQILARSNPNMSSSYIIDNVKIEKVPPGQVSFQNYNEDSLSISTETNRPIYGNNSLRVYVKPGNDTTKWNKISTDFIPVNENEYYNFSLYLSAKDVNQLHSKVNYFDSNKTEIKSAFISGGRNGTFEAPYNIIDSSLNGTKYMQLQILARSNPNMSSSYIIDNVKIEKVPPGQVSFQNYNEDSLSISTETNRPIFGNGSLRTDVKQGNTDDWSIISTDFIPVNENEYYNFSLYLSAKDVNQLHPKIIYYDLNKKITKSDSFSGQDGSFSKTYERSILPPIGTGYLRLQIFVHPNPVKLSSYWIDNIKLEEIIPKRVLLTDDFTSFGKINPTVDGQRRDETFAPVSANYNVYQSKPFPVKQNSDYNYTMNIETENLSSLSGIASFRNSSDVVVNLTKYGNNASNGGVLSLSPESEIYTDLDVIKPSNYTVALRAKTCETCTFLRLSLLRNDDSNNINSTIQTSNISLKDKTSQLKLVYSNSTYLKQGTYKLKIYSDSQTDLDSVIMYSTQDNSNSSNTKKGNEAVEDNFNQIESTAANITEYKKINPTKYVVNIKNASRPYVISFAESYDPLWIAYSDTDDSNINELSNKNENFMAYSIPLYGVTNGFYVNKTGDYSLIIEYQPQKWFIQGATISILFLAAMFAGLLLLRKRRTMRKLYLTIKKTLSRYRTDKNTD